VIDYKVNLNSLKVKAKVKASHFKDKKKVVYLKCRILNSPQQLEII